MFTVLLIFHAIIALLLIVVVLIQPGKDDAGSLIGGSSTSAFGADTGAVLTKTTAILGAIFMLNSLLLSVVGSKLLNSHQDSVIKKVETKK